MFSNYFSGNKDASSQGGSSATGAAAGSSSEPGQLHPPHKRLSSPDATFGPLTVQDNSWNCGGGFATETQTFYAMTPGKNAKFVMVQVIHAGVGMWYPQINFNLRFYDPATKKAEWRSASVSGFTTPAPSSKGSATQYDKRSAKADQFSILLDPAKPDTYVIQGKYDVDTDVSLTFKRVDSAPGFKLGSGPKGGMTYFGAEKQSSASNDGGPAYSAGTDGYVIHRFWPRCQVSGVLRMGKEVLALDSGSRGIFIHAIQGMRANLVACRWNFGYFSSEEEKEGVSLMMMEFTSTSAYGNKTVNIGSVVVDDQLVAVVADGKCTHLENGQVDSDTDYAAPGKIHWQWAKSRSLLPSSSSSDSGSSNTVEAEIMLDLQPEGSSSTSGTGAAPAPRSFRGLIEKVDVLAQIPYLVKKVIAYVAGTKPYIYQFHNDTTAEIILPSTDGSSEPRKLNVKGYMFNEATFISLN